MQRIWKEEGVPVPLDGENVKKYWKQIQSGVKDYLIREYWNLEAKKITRLATCRQFFPPGVCEDRREGLAR